MALLLGATPAPATVVEGLYEAEVVVSGKDPGLRDEAIGRALAQVLAKVSGVRDAAGRPGVRRALAQPAPYLQQYLYETRTRAVGAEGRPTPVQVLRVEFNRGAVDALLVETGLPLWSRTRPALLAWLVIEDAGQRRFASPAEDQVLWARLATVAGERGVPLIEPLLDLEDRASLKVADVWNQAAEPVWRAARRYSPEAVLLGRAYRTSAQTWAIDWALLRPEGQSTFTSRGPDLAALVEDGAHRSADELAARFAVAGAEPEGVLITVRGVERLDDYARALDYLETLDLVERVQVAGLDGAAVTFRVEARGGAAGLRRAFALGRTIAVEPGSLAYRLLPR